MTIYIFCVSEEEKFKVKSIYQHTRKYLHSWFPKLPSYQAFCNRLNRLAAVFPVLVMCLLPDVDQAEIEVDVSLLDSMPIITCSGKRAGKIAPQLTDKGYCSTKRLHYYGAKLHSIAFHRPGTLPMPEFFSLTKASEHDLNAVREILPHLTNRALVGDKAYSNEELNEAMRQFKHAADKLFSTAVSRIRQPIESLFNWIIEKTDIQPASKVRSRQGLIVHVFGKIAAAITNWVF